MARRRRHRSLGRLHQRNHDQHVADCALHRDAGDDERVPGAGGERSWPTKRRFGRLARAQVPDWLPALFARGDDSATSWLILAPGAWIALGLALVPGRTVLRYTVFGRHVFALGSNESTARLCGINVPRLKIAVYTLSGLFIGLAGRVPIRSLSGRSSPTSGIGYELKIIAAVVIGGASLSGGRGSVLGTLAGGRADVGHRNRLHAAGMSAIRSSGHRHRPDHHCRRIARSLARAALGSLTCKDDSALRWMPPLPDPRSTAPGRLRRSAGPVAGPLSAAVSGAARRARDLGRIRAGHCSRSSERPRSAGPVLGRSNRARTILRRDFQLDVEGRSPREVASELADCLAGMPLWQHPHSLGNTFISSR